MYVDPNFPTLSALKKALASGDKVYVFQPDMGCVPTGTAEVSLEGPHYPKPHKWYARVRIVDGLVVKVLR